MVFVIKVLALMKTEVNDLMDVIKNASNNMVLNMGDLNFLELTGLL